MTGPRDFKKVEELYHAALARPPAERDAFLEEASNGDEDLRREVKSLLGYEEAAKQLLEEPVAEAATQNLAVVQGTRLGPYEVTDLIGSGGMGEVYRARDTRLGRDVAIKVLPEQVAHDREALTRLGREGRAVAALSHPHIAALYDIGEHDGTHYLVMELLEGETLAARLRRGALPEKEVLRIGAEIAEALGAAHAHGIVHRDVKPANVMLTRSGSKLLDFSLARLPRRPGLSGETATATTGLGEGVIAGTLPYMAPEHLDGRQVDARTDIWALGCVLFEMLTGRRAFAGDSQAGLIAAIEKDEAPSMVSHRPGTPAALDRLGGQCLKKDPADRWQSAQDLGLRLREIAEADRLAAAELRDARRSRLFVPLLVAGVVLAVLAGVFAGRLWRPPSAASPAGTRRFERLTFRSGHFSNARFAPDGQTVFYAAAWEGRPREIFQARPGIGGELSLGMSGAELLAVSQSGELAVLLPRMRSANPYNKSGTLAVLPASGGTPRELAEDVVFADWAPDGRTLAVVRRVGGVLQLEYPLGTVLYRAPQDVLNCPRISPDGGKIALFEPEGDRVSVVVIDRSGARRSLSTGWFDWWLLAWSPRGDEIWFGASRAGLAAALYAVRLDGVERSLLQAPGTLELHDIAPNGRALVASLRSRSQMFGREAGASQERNLAWLELSSDADLSDDGRHLLFSGWSEREGGTFGVYLRDLSGAAAIRLGDGYAQDLSSDGRWALALGGSGVVALPIGAGRAREHKLPLGVEAARFLPDGDRFVLVASESPEAMRLFVAGFGAEPPRPFGPEIALRLPSVRESRPLTVSPDGRLVAYADAAGGIAVVPIERGEVLRIPGVGLNDLPVQWSPDSRRLFIFDPGEIPARLFTVDIERGERRLVRVIEPRDPAGVTGIAHISMTRDGQAYAYSHQQDLSDLFVVEGLR